CGGWRYCESPLVEGDHLICTPGGKDAILVPLDKKTRKVVWKAQSPFGNPEAGYSSIVVADVGKVRHYVQLTGSGVLGVRASDGKVLWTHDKFRGNTANIPPPIVLGDHVFAAAGYGRGGVLLKLSKTEDGVEAEEVYYKRELTNKHGGLV